MKIDLASDEWIIFGCVVLGLGHLAFGISERYEWFEWLADDEEAHFGHGSALVVWWALAALFYRTRTGR